MLGEKILNFPKPQVLQALRASVGEKSLMEVRVKGEFRGKESGPSSPVRQVKGKREDGGL